MERDFFDKLGDSQLMRGNHGPCTLLVIKGQLSDNKFFPFRFAHPHPEISYEDKRKSTYFRKSVKLASIILRLAI
jgi:hypothetical protein